MHSLTLQGKVTHRFVEDCNGEITVWPCRGKVTHRFVRDCYGELTVWPYREKVTHKFVSDCSGEVTVWPCKGEVTHRFVRDCDGGGPTGLSETVALNHRAAEADFQKLLHMIGERCATCHDEPHFPSQPCLDLVEDQLVKERRGLWSIVSCTCAVEWSVAYACSNRADSY